MALWWGNSPQIVKLQGPKLHNSSSSDFPNTWANHRKNLSWPHTHTNPNCTLCQMNDKDTWPHLLSLCNNKFLKSLRIARHNVDAHQVTNLLKSNLCTRHLTLINAGNQHGNHQKNTIMPWILSCTRNTTRCECLAKLRPDLVYIHGAAFEQNGPLIPTPDLTIQIIEFTFTHERFLDQSIQTKEIKYNQLGDAIRAQGWNISHMEY